MPTRTTGDIGRDKEYSYEEYLKEFAPEVIKERELKEEKNPQEIGREIAHEALERLKQSLAEE